MTDDGKITESDDIRKTLAERDDDRASEYDRTKAYEWRNRWSSGYGKAYRL